MVLPSYYILQFIGCTRLLLGRALLFSDINMVILSVTFDVLLYWRTFSLLQVLPVLLSLDSDLGIFVLYIYHIVGPHLRTGFYILSPYVLIESIFHFHSSYTHIT